MSKIRTIAAMLLAWMLWCLMLYALGAFVAADFNIARWAVEARYVLGFMGGAGCWMIAAAVIEAL